MITSISFLNNNTANARLDVNNTAAEALKSRRYASFPNLSPLNADTVSFGATKREKSKEIDSARLQGRVNEPESFAEEIGKIKLELADAIEKNDVKKILKRFGISVINESSFFDTIFRRKLLKNNEDKLVISKYQQPSEDFTFEDIGIDENKLFEKIEKIEGNAFFRNSHVTNLGQLKTIGGHAYFCNSQITDLGQLKTIGKNALFSNSKVTSLGQLEFIGGSADFRNSKVADLGQLKTIGWDADFRYSEIADLGQLEKVGRDADFRYSEVADLGQLEKVGKNVYVKNSLLKPADFDNVEVGGRVDK